MSKKRLIPRELIRFVAAMLLIMAAVAVAAVAVDVAVNS